MAERKKSARGRKPKRARAASRARKPKRAASPKKPPAKAKRKRVARKRPPPARAAKRKRSGERKPRARSMAALPEAKADPALASAAAAPAPVASTRFAESLALLGSIPVRVGTVRHYFPRARCALLVLESPLAAGERVHVRGATSDFLASAVSLRVASAPVPRASEGEATLALPERARPGDVVYALRAPA